MPAPAAGVPLLLGKVTLLWRHFLDRNLPWVKCLIRL